MPVCEQETGLQDYSSQQEAYTSWRKREQERERESTGRCVWSFSGEKCSISKCWCKIMKNKMKMRTDCACELRGEMTLQLSAWGVCFVVQPVSGSHWFLICPFMLQTPQWLMRLIVHLHCRCELSVYINIHTYPCHFSFCFRMIPHPLH